MNQDNPSSIVVPGRRPVFTRDWTPAKGCTRWPVTNKVAPNAISLAGMAGGMVAGIALAATPLPETLTHVMFLTAVAGIIVADGILTAIRRLHRIARQPSSSC
jgi:hypothetical protein